MTPEQCKEMLPIFQAYAEGKTIQGKFSGGWVELTCPSFCDPATSYRIKPEPKLRAWTASEVPVGAILDTGCPGVVKYLIVAVTGSGVGVCSSSGTHNYPFQHLLGPDYKHSTDHGKTWKPCGVYE